MLTAAQDSRHLRALNPASKSARSEENLQESVVPKNLENSLTLTVGRILLFFVCARRVLSRDKRAVLILESRMFKLRYRQSPPACPPRKRWQLLLHPLGTEHEATKPDLSRLQTASLYRGKLCSLGEPTTKSACSEGCSGLRSRSDPIKIVHASAQKRLRQFAPLRIPHRRGAADEL